MLERRTRRASRFPPKDRGVPEPGAGTAARGAGGGACGISGGGVFATRPRWKGLAHVDKAAAPRSVHQAGVPSSTSGPGRCRGASVVRWGRWRTGRVPDVTCGRSARGGMAALQEVPALRWRLHKRQEGRAATARGACARILRITASAQEEDDGLPAASA